MDWNTFFSTISQTSGAIVGIFSAFLITKIVANQADFQRSKQKAGAFLNKSQTLTHETEVRSFQWYNDRRSDIQVEEINIMYHKSNEILDAEQYYATLKFSPFQSKNDAILIIQRKIDELQEEKRAEEERTHSRLLSAAPGFAILTATIPHIPNLSVYVKGIAEERELIDNLLVRVTQQNNMNRELSTELRRSPESSPLVSFSICAVLLLFFSGVIYPLSFLPLNPNQPIVLRASAFWDILFSLKGAMLTIVSSTFCGLIFTFLIVNIRLRHEEKTIKGLETYSHLSNYSEFFKNYEDAIKYRNSMPPTAE